MRTYLLTTLEPLDLDALLITKRLIKDGLSEKNNPDAAAMRETSENAVRAASGVVAKRFAEIASGERKHKL